MDEPRCVPAWLPFEFPERDLPEAYIPRHPDRAVARDGTGSWKDTMARLARASGAVERR